MILNLKSSLIQVITSTLDKQFEIKSIQDDKIHEKKIAGTSHINSDAFFLHPCDLCFMVRIDFNFFPFTTNESIEDCEVMLTFSFQKYSKAFLSFFFKCYMYLHIFVN